MPTADPLQHYRRWLCRCPGLGMQVDLSRMDFPRGFWSEMEPKVDQAYQAMDDLEAGQIANPDEQRMVGHYWLRDPERAPDRNITEAIGRNIDQVKQFAKDVHTGAIAPPRTRRFTDLLVIGIGGSALGPQLVADCLGSRSDRMRVHFLDNTDPDGHLRLLDRLGTRLRSSLVLVISKSGKTPEPYNALAQSREIFDHEGLDFPRHAVAITGEGSQLDQQARDEGWLKRFPMWDWVGGRMSVTAAVGLVPAALQGIDIDRFLNGAARMDRLTRQHDTKKNPAAQLALAWYHATNGRAEKNMVVLPYKDRLLLFSRYLQQLVMESLGKKHDLSGNVVHQGITVYGNKGSTDQHAYVQQLRDGANDFFATFIVVQRDTPQPGRQSAVNLPDHEPAQTPGDYLHGFYLGTRKALYEAGRESITISLDKLDAGTLGALIALYERAVGFYASLVNINAYHQPGVEAGKQAAASLLALQDRMIEYLRAHPETAYGPGEIAEALDEPDQAEAIQHLAQHLLANQRHIEKSHNKYIHRQTSSP